MSGRKARFCLLSAPKHGSGLGLLATFLFALAVPAPGADVTLRRVVVPLRFVDYAFAVEKDAAGVPVMNWEKFHARPRNVVSRKTDGIVLENGWFRATLIPAMGRLHSFIDKQTGHEQLWINPIAIPLGANNDTGFWMTWGGIEHVMPRGEHGTSHALAWTWNLEQSDTARCAVRMTSTEPITGLHHSITYVAHATRPALETHIEIRNATAKPASFSHWTTATLAPGGRGEVTPRTEIIVPAEAFVPDDRDFNAWMTGMAGPTESSALRWVGTWKDIGDLMATPLREPYFAVYSHELRSGLLRTFDLSATPGFDIWGWGYPPTERRQREFTDHLPSAGYIEIWNGTTHGFSDEQLGTIAPGASLLWTETTSTVSGIKDSELRSEIARRSRDAIAQKHHPAPTPPAVHGPEELIAGVEIETIVTGKPETSWFQSRPTVIPGAPATIFLTTQELRPNENHGYYDIFLTTSKDGGSSWSAPVKIPELCRVPTDDGYERVAGDLWPSWHPPTKRVLVTGKTFHFAEGKRENNRREEVAYSVFNPNGASWSELRTVQLPDIDHEGKRFVAPNAGCNQPVVLDIGEILLPIRYQKDFDQVNYTTTVARCSFDGETLSYVGHGTELTHPHGRGFYEPSLAKFQDRFYLTLRADESGYVASSPNGMEFAEGAKEWRFDDGEPLGSYNTQQHWIVHPRGKGLFLAYTRKGANNDHIFRHRAPLFVARVDPESLQVVRATERLLVPENHACLGNFGVCSLSDRETLVVTSEFLRNGTKRAGEPNRVILARIRWTD